MPASKACLALLLEVQGDDLKRKNPEVKGRKPKGRLSPWIQVGETVGPLTLRKCLGGGGAGNRAKGKKVTVVNLDIDLNDSGSNNGTAFTNVFGVGTEGLTNDTWEKFKLLCKKLLSCDSCPHGVSAYCAKHPNGAHVRVSVQHIRSWAKLLVRSLAGF